MTTRDSQYIHNISSRRNSGILVHPTSFPSPYGIGDMGKGAYDFINFLSDAGVNMWQVLPLGPTGYGDSPYQSFSAYAGQPLIISPDKFREDGLLSDSDLASIPSWQADKIDYGYVMYYKYKLFDIAFRNFTAIIGQNQNLRCEYERFLIKNNFWLDNYALYMAIKDNYNGASWLDWPEHEKLAYSTSSGATSNGSYSDSPNDSSSDSVLNELTVVYSERMRYYYFLQFEFFRQWMQLKDYANSKGVYIIGDIPIFVSLDSADVWSEKKVFKLNEKGYPLEVSGVPPDYFSSTGQLWGNPIYDWDYLKNEGYSWWINRIKHQLTLVDFLRIDHFRGFEAYWSVPYGEATAVNGHWVKGPGAEFFEALRSSLLDVSDNLDNSVSCNNSTNNIVLPIFAEDLGIITPEVEELRDRFNLPGMRVLQFGFDNTGDSTFIPHHFVKNCICYTGTHDNDTTKGWYATRDDATKKKICTYLHTDGADICYDMIRAAYGSVAKYAIIPIQDILSVDSTGRMNTPGVGAGNWQWRYRDNVLSKDISSKLRELLEIYARL